MNKDQKVFYYNQDIKTIIIKQLKQKEIMEKSDLNKVNINYQKKIAQKTYKNKIIISSNINNNN